MKEEESINNEEESRRVTGAPEMADTDNSVMKEDKEKILLEINEHPFTCNWIKSTAALSLILVSSILSFFIIRNPVIPVIIFIFFIISNASFFMPSRYTFTEEKIIVNRIIYCKSYPWSRFKGYSLDRNGIYLSPTPDPDSFDRFRGVFLVMGFQNRQSLREILKEKIDGSNISIATPGSKGN